MHPIPKPSGGGLFSGIHKIGSDIVKGIIDSACNIEVPVVKGGKIPKWLNFGKFAHPTSFPPAAGGGPKEPEDPEDPTETPQSSQALSSSCSQSAYVSCDSSRLVSDSITQASMSCTTTTACSGADITKVTATTFVCSQTAIQDCQGTVIVSGSASSATFFATSCSTRSACSGSGITSVTTSVVSSSATPLLHIFEPELEDKVIDEQQCVLSLVQAATAAIEEADYSNCFGKTVDSVTSNTLVLNPAYETTSGSSGSESGDVISTSVGGGSSAMPTPSANETSSVQPKASNIPASDSASSSGPTPPPVMPLPPSAPASVPAPHPHHQNPQPLPTPLLPPSPLYDQNRPTSPPP